MSFGLDGKSKSQMVQGCQIGHNCQMSHICKIDYEGRMVQKDQIRQMCQKAHMDQEVQMKSDWSVGSGRSYFNLSNEPNRLGRLEMSDGSDRSYRSDW